MVSIRSDVKFKTKKQIKSAKKSKKKKQMQSNEKKKKEKSDVFLPPVGVLSGLIQHQDELAADAKLTLQLKGSAETRQGASRVREKQQQNHPISLHFHNVATKIENVNKVIQNERKRRKPENTMKQAMFSLHTVVHDRYSVTKHIRFLHMVGRHNDNPIAFHVLQEFTDKTARI
jgi:hypothetical protein